MVENKFDIYTKIVQNVWNVSRQLSKSSIGLDVFVIRTHWFIGRSKVTLMESPHLVRSEGPDDCVKDTPIVEENKVILAPVMRVDQLLQCVEH